MEQRLKERMIGAIVLVAVGIFVIPALLDGPDQPTTTREVALDGTVPTRRVEIALDESVQASAAAASTPIADETAKSAEPDTKGSGPATAVEQSPVPESAPAPVQRESAPPPVAAKAPAPAPAAVSAKPPAGNWAAQVGSFAKKSSANRIARQLDAAGFDSYVSEMTQGGKTLYRVRVGPVVSREEADDLIARLDASGHKAKVMPHP